MPPPMRTASLALLLCLLFSNQAAAGLHFGAPGRRSMEVTGKVQLRFTGASGDESALRIRRLRLELAGSASSRVSYEVEFSAAPRHGVVPDRFELLDAYAILDAHSRVQIKVGQFKAPFGAETLTSSTRILATDRALASELAPDRQIGVMLVVTGLSLIVSLPIARARHRRPGA